MPQVLTFESRWSRVVLYGIGLVGGLIAMYYPTLFSGFRVMQTDPGDPVLNHYFVEHSYRWLSQQDYRGTFWSPPFFAPTALVLTWSESLIGAAPFYWVLRLGFSEESAWVLWMLLMSLLNYLSMLLVLRRFSVHPILAMLGGYIFAFGIVRADMLSHHHLQPHFLGPWVVLLYYRFIREPSARRWCLLVILSVWQLLMSIHLGWFLAIGLGLVTLLWLRLEPQRIAPILRFFRFRYRTSLAVVLLVGVGLGLFFRTYFQGNEGYRRHYSEMLSYSPTPIEWLAAPQGSLWGETFVAPDPVDHEERRLFSGFVLTFLLGLGLLMNGRIRSAVDDPDRRFRQAALLSCLLMGLLCTRLMGGFSLWWVIANTVPGASAIRVPGRIILMMLLLGLIAGLPAFQYWFQTIVTNSSRRSLWYLLLAVLCIGEQLHLRPRQFEGAKFYECARELSHEFVDADLVFVPYSREVIPLEHEHNLTVMWAGLWANTPVINGYTGRVPSNYPHDAAKGDYMALKSYLGEHWTGRLLVIELRNPN